MSAEHEEYLRARREAQRLFGPKADVRKETGKGSKKNAFAFRVFLVVTDADGGKREYLLGAGESFEKALADAKSRLE